MSALLPAAQRLAAAPESDALFLPAWRGMDDAALLAHYRSDRGVVFDAVVDPEEVLPKRIEGLMQGRFEFNGETHSLGDPIDWLVNPSADIEWHILLHKFYYATGLSQAWQRSADFRYAKRWAELIDGWMRVTPPGFIAADVTGRRVQNWIYSLQGLVLPGPKGLGAPVDPAFFRRLLQSIHAQVEFLCANLTPKRNHRTLELLAVFLAGVVFPEFARAQHWRAFALRETLANIQADLLPDGVHCELSTDYHHLALRNWFQVRTLAARNGHGVPAAMDEALQRAFDFSVHVHQPHGGAPSFSDGDARGYQSLLRQAAHRYRRPDLLFVATAGAEGDAPAHRNAHFNDSGYHVLRGGWPRLGYADAQHLMFDCGPLGEGNHGHFDALSFELAAFGRPLIVDPGRYTYSEAGETNWRVHFRGTAAHNTVCVDGRSQTRYSPRAIKEPSRHAQGAVRHKISGPPPDTRLIEALDGESLDLLHGRCSSHEYDAIHDRCIVFIDRRYWIVSDWLRAPGEHDFVVSFQLGAEAADVSVLHRAAGLRLDSPNLSIALPARTDQRTELASAWVSARYGHKDAAPVLRTHARGRNVDFDCVLVPWGDRAPALQVEDRIVRSDDGHAVNALRIHLAQDSQTLHDGWFHDRGVPAEAWRIGSHVFNGRWIHWREAADGRILRAWTHAGATLHDAEGQPIAVRIGVAP